MKFYLDVETTAGLKGPLALVQYSIDRGPIRLIENPYSTGKEEMDYIYGLLENKDTTVVGYNIGFDIGKLYQYFQPDHAFDCEVVDLWLKVLKLEPLCHYPFIGGKPMLVLKKIHVDYVDILEETVKGDLKQFLPKNLGEISCSHRETDDKNFTTLEFRPKIDAKLKTLVPLFAPEKALETLQFSDVLYLPKNVKLSPDGEINGIGKDAKGKAWREDMRVPFISGKTEIKRYSFLHQENKKILKTKEGREKFLTYGKKDVEYLHQLEDFLIKENSIEKLKPNYNDTVTHIVAYTRNSEGFEVDLPLAKKENEKLEIKKKELEGLVGINLNSSPQRKKLVASCLIPVYQKTVGENLESTGIPILEQLLKDGCIQEEKEKIVKGMIKYRSVCQVIKQFEMVLLGKGRFYPDFRVLGTITDRLAGTNGFNSQGVSKKSAIRQAIKTRWGGDFDSLEVVIAAEYYQDEILISEIANGIDLHTKNVQRLFSKYRNVPLEELMKIKKDESHPDHQDFSDCRNIGAKGLFFGVIYGSESQKQAEQLDTTPEEAEETMDKYFFSQYKMLKKSREELQKDYCTADFDTWDTNSIDRMKRYTENLYGDRRFIDFEADVARWFWQNTERYAALVPKSDNRKVIRMVAKGKQKIRQTIRSACMGATSKIQKSIARQSGNYPIQSTGAKATKRLMCAIWDAGYKVFMFNIHDEIQIGHHRLVDVEGITNVTQKFIKKEQEVIPYLSMACGPHKTWAER